MQRAGQLTSLVAHVYIRYEMSFFFVAHNNLSKTTLSIRSRSCTLHNGTNRSNYPHDHPSPCIITVWRVCPTKSVSWIFFSIRPQLDHPVSVQSFYYLDIILYLFPVYFSRSITFRQLFFSAGVIKVSDAIWRNVYIASIFTRRI